MSYIRNELEIVFGATLRIKPTEDWEIIPFWSYMKLRDEENGPIIFTAGDFLPKRIKRGQFHGQKWADFSANLGNHGVVTRGTVAGVKAELLYAQGDDVNEDVGVVDFEAGGLKVFVSHFCSCRAIGGGGRKKLKMKH